MSGIMNPFEQLFTSILFLLIPLGVSFWKITGTLDQFTEFRWLLLYGICTLLVAGSFFPGFEIRVPSLRKNRLFYFLVSGLAFFCGFATFRNFPGQIELQMLDWSCFFVLFVWSYTLSIQEDSRALFLRSIRFANRIGLLGVGLYLIAQKTGYSWSYLASYSGHFGSLFGHKNFAASFFGIALLIEMSGFNRDESNSRKVWSAFLILLGLYGFYCTKARGASLGFAVGLLVFGFRRVKLQSRMKWIIVSALIVMSCYAAAVVSYRGLEDGTNTRDLRIARWLNTAAMIVDHPLGIGPGHYEFDYLFYTKRVRADVEIDGRFISRTPHNQPLQIGVDYGIPALLFWILLTGFIVLRAFRSKSDEGAILVCILVDGMFAFPLHVTHSFVAYAVFSGILLGRNLSSRPVSGGLILPVAKGLSVVGMSWVTYAIFSAVMAESYDINHYESMKVSCDRAPWRFNNCIFLAKIEGNLGKFQDGIQTCKKVLERQPNGFPAYLTLSELYRLSGDQRARCDAIAKYDSILGGNTKLYQSVQNQCFSGMK
jgi:O-antigen ligase